MVFVEDLEMEASEPPSSDPTRFSLYLREAGQEPLLTPEQEMTLAHCICQGQQAARRLACEPFREAQTLEQLQQQVQAGHTARERFFKANMRLVVHIAKGYQARGLPFVDLVQEGNLGLLRAIEKYDPTYLNPATGEPHRFSTYATYWIRQTIRRALGHQTRPIRLPDYLHEQTIKMYNIRRQFHQRFQRDPTPAELAERLNMDIGKLAVLLQVNLPPLSLASPVGDGGERELGDFIEDRNALDPVEQVEREALRQTLASALAKLHPRLQ